MSQLQFPPEFFKKEERCGFTVGEPMKRNWAAQMQVLEDVRELCERHDIRWFAYSGTALGAVRHKGFIPWDDDVDICFVGEDYINFLLYAQDELSDRYKILNPYAEPDWEIDSFARITAGKSMSFDSEYLDRFHNCPFLVGTDVFPFYYVPRDKEKKEYILDLLHRTVALENLNKYNLELQKAGKTAEVKEMNDIIAEGLVNMQKDSGFEFTADRSLANQLAMLFDQIGRLTLEEEADYVARYSDIAEDEKRNFSRKELFDKTVLIPFETIKVPLPHDSDRFLMQQYGSKYMTFIKSGATHEYPYFGKQFRVYKNLIEKADWQKRRKETGETDLTVPEKQALSESKNKKCKVLFYTGVREMLIYSEHVMDKIKYVVEYFKSNKDRYDLYWMPGEFIENCEKGLPFSRVIPDLVKEYNAFIDDFKREGFGICDQTADLNKAIDACDMYYGDESFLSELFSQTSKPIFIQDYRIKDMRLEGGEEE